MPGGEPFSVDQRRTIDQAREQAGSGSGLDFHVYVGPAGGDPRATAQRLHGELPVSPRCVLVLVDPPGHAVEVVTGPEARRLLSDSACGLAVLSMQTAFAAGDLVGGLVHGLHQLGDAARRPETLHADKA